MTTFSPWQFLLLALASLLNRQQETYISEHFDTRFTLFICPNCLKREQAQIVQLRQHSNAPR